VQSIPPWAQEQERAKDGAPSFILRGSATPVDY